MESTWVVIANYQYSSEAQIFKGRLEAEGIQVHLQDEYTIDTDPLMSHAIGGVKLKVHREYVGIFSRISRAKSLSSD